MRGMAWGPAPAVGGVILIIAWGNDLRGDDGAGRYLAARLQRRWQQQGLAVRRLAVPQLVPELAIEVAAAEVAAVVFVDTRLATAADPNVRVTALTSSETASALGHHLEPQTVLAYAALLRAEPLPPAWLVTVPGWVFAHGRRLSPATRTAIARFLDDDQGTLTRLTAALQRLVAFRAPQL